MFSLLAGTTITWKYYLSWHIWKESGITITVYSCAGKCDRLQEQWRNTTCPSTLSVTWLPDPTWLLQPSQPLNRLNRQGQCGGEIIYVLLYLRIQDHPCPLSSRYRHLTWEVKQYCISYFFLNKWFCLPVLLWINKEWRKQMCTSLPFPRHLESPHRGGYNSKVMLVPLAAPPQSPLVGFCPGLRRIHFLWHYCSSH